MFVGFSEFVPRSSSFELFSITFSAFAHTSSISSLSFNIATIRSSISLYNFAFSSGVSSTSSIGAGEPPVYIDGSSVQVSKFSGFFTPSAPNMFFIVSNIANCPVLCFGGVITLFILLLIMLYFKHNICLAKGGNGGFLSPLAQFMKFVISSGYVFRLGFLTTAPFSFFRIFTPKRKSTSFSIYPLSYASFLSFTSSGFVVIS